MGVRSGLLVLLALWWTLPPGCAVGTCDGFKHVENGRTFFRYGGLYVTFTCNLGFKLHGYQTNSCLSGRWIRDPPVCVASGCPDPGHPQHGSSTVTHDGSFVAFTCQRGYRLYGPQLLYCRGGIWNGTRPLCRESDMMNSEKQKYLSPLRFKIEQNAHLPLSQKERLSFWYNRFANTPLKDIFPKPGLLGKELLRNSHQKPLPEVGILTFLSDTIPQERGLPRKQLSSQTSEAGIEFKNTYVEPTGYTTPVELLAFPTFPTPETKFLSTSSPESLSSSPELSEVDVHEDVYPQTGEILTQTVGSALRLTWVAGRPNREAPSVESAPLTISALVAKTSVQRAENKLQVQRSTPEVHTIFTAQHQESKTWASPSSSDQVHFQGFSSTTSSPRKVSDLQTQSTFITAWMADTLTSHSAPENHAASMDEASSAIDKFRARNFTRRKPAANDDDSEELHSGTTTVDFVKSQKEISALVYAQERKMTGPPVENSTMPQDPLGVAGAEPPIKGSSGLHSLISSRPAVSARNKEGCEQQPILLAKMQDGLHPKGELQGEASPEPSVTPYLESGQPTGKPTDATNRIPFSENSPDSEAWTLSPDQESVGPSWYGDSTDWAVTGTHQTSTTGSVQESVSSLFGWLSTRTSHTARGDQEDKTGSDPEKKPIPVTVNALPVPGPRSSHDVIEVGGFGQLWVRRQRPTCPYPPVPAHGTFYFRTVANPTPQQYKHFVQYACYPGYTLANGDVYSYCLENGKWSGITPVCVEETPCSISNGGCSQVCDFDSRNRAHCLCRSGFQLLEDGRTCRDQDECAERTHGCQQICVNTFGSFVCHCELGYLLSSDGKACFDRDECAVNNGGCTHHCTNSAGTFRCFCHSGFLLANDLVTCQDVDECKLPVGVATCLFGCINTPGSFRCHCPKGYQLGTADGHCQDIDECQEVILGQRRCEWRCVNLPGSHRCICPRGYKLDSDGFHCRDVNECLSKNGDCPHTCINYRGGYKCGCPEFQHLPLFNRKRCQLTL